MTTNDSHLSPRRAQRTYENTLACTHAGTHYMVADHMCHNETVVGVYSTGIRLSNQRFEAVTIHSQQVQRKRY